jgi:hypothetical protein
MIDQSFRKMLSEDVQFTLSGSAKDWQSAPATFPSDLRVIMKCISQQRTSKENLLAASATCLWFLSNFTRAKLEKEYDLWSSFVPILNGFARTYKGSLDEKAYIDMKTNINTFMDGETKKEKVLCQPVPAEYKDGTLLDYYVNQATKLNDEFDRKLKSFNNQAISVPKKKERAKEKADLAEDEGGYNGDYGRVLDYLRGTVFIDVDRSTSSQDLKKKFDRVIGNLAREIGPIERQKIFPMDVNKGPPRFLLNLRFKNNSLKTEIICEVQIRFSLYGFDQDFQDFLHMVYELERKPMKDINWKPHVLELSKEMLAKTGIHLTEDFFNLWFAKASLIELRYDKGKEENEDKLKIVVTKNKGSPLQIIKKLSFDIAYILDKDGDPLKVTGKTDKYQFQLVPSPSV